jgi:hypothetical protein
MLRPQYSTRVALFFFAALCALSFAVAQHQQLPLTITLTVFDAAGHFRQLTFGVHPEATYEFEREFGEMLIPPIPPAPVFDVRFVDLPGRRRFAGTGSETDIRTFSSSSQADTFLVRFQSAESARPLRFQWSADVRDKCDSLRMECILGNKLLSLQATDINSFELDDDSATWLRIMLFGPRWNMTQ